jgi:hypothetical protein
MTGMNEEAKAMVEKVGQTVETAWPRAWLPSPIVRVADRIFEKLGMN